LHRFFAAWQSGFARNFTLQTLIAAALLSVPANSFAAPATGEPQVLKGHVPKITKKLSPLGRLNGNDHMDVAIGLPLRNREQLTNLLTDIYNPSSPNFRHFLTADQFTASFGPSAEDYQSVIDFAKAHHLNVTLRHPNRTLVHVTGSVADIENAFHVHMQTFQHPKENRIFFAPDAEPSLDLKTPVLAISGLDNYVKPRPLIHPSVSPGIRPLGGGGGGGGGTGGGPFDGFDYLNAYAPGVSQDGAGQSLGLFELFGFNGMDITDYEDEVGISPYVTVTPVLIDGASGSDDVDYTTQCGYLDYAFEATGDIEMAISMAPGLSSVLVYEGPTPLDQPPLGSSYIQDATTTAQVNDVFNRMATDNLAKQLSCSYGMDINLSTVQIFQQFAAQGQSLFIASGDFGAFSSTVWSFFAEPADDPYATIVGGTTLMTNSAAQWASETTWNGPAGTDACGNSVPAQAPGGGISKVYSIPSWQQGISMTANQGSTTMRNAPDVSLVANNINIVWGNTFIGLSTDWTVTGTSMATPLWAGFIALVNQQAVANGQPPIGFANPALYAIGKSTSYHSCFHDITTGNNENGTSPARYSATAGYDLCTGWGTIIGTNLMQALLAPPLDNLRITSPVGFTSQGPSGGPFSVTTQTYTLANTGTTPLTWSLTNTSSWLTVSATGGTLNPGSSTSVTVSLNANANSFLINHASGNVAFNNLTAGTTQNRQFDLYVGNGGFETGDFSNWTLVGDTNLNFALAMDSTNVAGQDALPGVSDESFVHSGIWGAYLGQWPLNGEPANGTLSHTIPTTAGQKLLVSFWLTSIPDASNDPPTNGFAVSWNGSTLFTQTNVTVSVWTNMQYIVSSTGSSGTLQFQFNNTPGAFGLDDVTVQTLPVPILSSTVVSGGNIKFSWSAILNDSYQIQSTTNLSTTNWTNVGSAILATNSVMSATEAIGNAPERFYRVMQSP
jgi:hypothetical protein